MENITIMGAGLMGHGIAQIFALKGHAVSLMDLSTDLLKSALDNIRSNLSLLAEHGIVGNRDIEPTLGRVREAKAL